MPARPARLARAACVALVLLVLPACGGEDDAPAADGAATQGPAGDAPASTGSDATPVEDEPLIAADRPEDFPCEAFPPEAVTAFLDDTYTASTVPFGACVYTPEDPRTSAGLALELVELEDGAGGYEADLAGSEGATGGVAQELSGVGSRGYVVQGEPGGLAVAVATAQVSESALLRATVSGGDAATLSSSAESLLRAALAVLDAS